MTAPAWISEPASVFACQSKPSFASCRLHHNLKGTGALLAMKLRGCSVNFATNVSAYQDSKEFVIMYGITKGAFGLAEQG